MPKATKKKTARKKPAAKRKSTAKRRPAAKKKPTRSKASSAKRKPAKKRATAKRKPAKKRTASKKKAVSAKPAANTKTVAEVATLAAPTMLTVEPDTFAVTEAIVPVVAARATEQSTNDSSTAVDETPNGVESDWMYHKTVVHFSHWFLFVTVFVVILFTTIIVGGFLASVV